jgi:hypothetical protein
MPIQPRAKAAAEISRPMAAEIAVRNLEASGELPGDKLADLSLQRLAFGRQLDPVEAVGGAHRSRTIRRPGLTLQPATLVCLSLP